MLDRQIGPYELLDTAAAFRLGGHRRALVAELLGVVAGEDDERVVMKARGFFVCDDGEAAHELALRGAGIVLKSIWDVGDDLDAGRLVEVLPEARIPATPLNAVYLHSRFLAPRVRLFVAYLTEQMTLAWKW